MASRQPKGTPVGGQFAANSHAEAQSDLAPEHTHQGIPIDFSYEQTPLNGVVPVVSEQEGLAMRPGESRWHPASDEEYDAYRSHWDERDTALGNEPQDHYLEVAQAEYEKAAQSYRDAAVRVIRASVPEGARGMRIMRPTTTAPWVDTFFDGNGVEVYDNAAAVRINTALQAFGNHHHELDDNFETDENAEGTRQWWNVYKEDTE